MLDLLLFAVFPYVASVLAIAVGIYRYFNDRFSFSSQSSQFLGTTRLPFSGSVLWHYAIIVVLVAHLIAFLLPSQWGDLVGVPIRLYVLEVTGWLLALVALAGLAWLIVQRLLNPRIFTATSAMDWVLLIVLVIQVAFGFWIAFSYRWGATWYARSVVPWLASLVTLDPQIQYVANFPWEIKVHILNAFLLLAITPFTRLVHLLSLPFQYLWRPYQVVIWNRRDQQKPNKSRT